MAEPMNRRKALSSITMLLAGIWGGVVSGLAGVFLGKPLLERKSSEEILIGDLSILGNSFKQVRIMLPVADGWNSMTEHKILYARFNNDNPAEPIVFSATCSHLGCTVNWDADAGDAGQFVCPCHGGRFAPDGAVISGPPPMGLTRVEARIKGGDVFARLS